MNTLGNGTFWRKFGILKYFGEWSLLDSFYPYWQYASFCSYNALVNRREVITWTYYGLDIDTYLRHLASMTSHTRCIITSQYIQYWLRERIFFAHVGYLDKMNSMGTWRLTKTE